jgi:hypothetical protein
LLVHNINVSLQEHHKKLFVYNKKTYKTKEKKLVDQLPSPGLQYMNIYSKTVRRMNCFSSVTQNTSVEEDPKLYLHGNASSYEGYLDSIIKKQPYQIIHEVPCLEESMMAHQQPISYSYMPENQVMRYQTYFTSPSYDPVSNIYFNIKRNEMIKAVKSNLKLESSTFIPTFLPTL